MMHKSHCPVLQDENAICLCQMGGLNIRVEAPGVISEDECWTAFCGPYLYTADTLFELLDVLKEEWCHDRHLVG